MKEIKLNDKVVRTIQVNTKKKLVTVVSQDEGVASRKGLAKFLLGFDSAFVILDLKDEFIKRNLNASEKVVTMSEPVKTDEFDPYIGVALALAYNLFGSKTKFRKYVKEEILKEKPVVKSKEQDKKKK